MSFLRQGRSVIASEESKTCLIRFKAASYRWDWSLVYFLWGIPYDANVSSAFCPSVFVLLFLDIIFNVFFKSDKPVRTFRHCLWFIGNLLGNTCKLVQILQNSVNEVWKDANNNLNVLLDSGFWSDETLSRVRKSFRDCDWMEKFPHGSLMSIRISVGMR